MQVESQTEILNRWNSEITNPEAEPDSWAQRIYARVIRFFVRAYGDGEWNRARRLENATDWTLPESTDGHPARSSTEIRETLVGLSQQQNLEGDFTLANDDAWIVVASRRDRINTQELGRVLHRLKIDNQLRTLGRDDVLEVRRSDFDTVRQLIIKNRDKLQIKRPLRNAASRAHNFGMAVALMQLVVACLLGAIGIGLFQLFGWPTGAIVPAYGLFSTMILPIITYAIARSYRMMRDT